MKEHRLIRLLPYAVAAAGIAIRLRQYLANRSLWIDEAHLAVAILDRSFPELVKPLGDVEPQHAPIGFLLLVKLMVTLFGSSEYSLRLIPLVAGCVSLILIYRVGRPLIGKTAAMIALFLYAFAGPLVYYSQEVKQYSSDTFFTLVAYALLVTRSPKRWFSAGIIGALLIWFSHPIMFVLFAILIATWPRYLKSSLFWLASFAVNFALITRTYLTDAKDPVWADKFLTLPQELSHLPVFLGKLNELFLLAGTPHPAAILFFVAGIAILWAQKKPRIALLFILPIVLTIVASLLRVYPSIVRLLLFLSPIVIMTVAVTPAAILSYARRYFGWIGVSVVGIVLYTKLFQAPVIHVLQLMKQPYQIEEIKPVLRAIEERRMPVDTLYVYGGFNAFRYYAGDYHLTDMPTTFREAPRFNQELLARDVDRLRGQSRVWILFSHMLPMTPMRDDEFILTYLDGIGRRLDQLQAPGVSAYLYDLSATPRDTTLH